MSERVLRVQAYTFACLAAISAIAGAATSFGYLEQIAVDRHGHAVFDTPEHGIRAGANVLLNYYAVHGLDTLEGILSRFCTGNRAEYATFLSRRLGIPPDVKFDVLARLPELLHAMARFESGQEWPRELFTGYSLVATAYRKGQR